jgi:flagellar protein FliO/FliZ
VIIKPIKTVLIILFISLGCVYGQPVASSSDGLLSLPASNTVQSSVSTVTAQPFYLDTQPASFPAFTASDPFGASLRIISSLFAVIILAFVISWLLQRKGGIGGNVFGKVLGILPLDNKRLIYLVDIMGRVLILGVADNSISLLCEITDKDTLDTLRLQYEKPAPGMEKLFSFLRRHRDSAAEGSEDTPLTPESRHENNQQRLRKLNELLVKRSNPNEEDSK